MARERPSLALATIVRDEEAVLAHCLDSVVGVVDEVVIVDTGSRDRTKDVVLSYGDRFRGVRLPDGTMGPGLTLADFDWIDDFSAARNYAVGLAHADWILQLDADEELIDGGSRMGDILRDKYLWAYLVYCVTVERGEDRAKSATTFSAFRLFRRRSDLRYLYPVHERVEPPPERTARSDVWINHFGPFLNTGKDKKGRNLPLLLKAVRDYPEDGYFPAKLGGEYLYSGEPLRALDPLQRAVELAEGLDREWRLSACRDLVLCHYESGDPLAAVRLAAEFQRKFPFYTDLFFLNAEIAYRVGDIERAVALYRHCLVVGDTHPVNGSWGGTGTWRPQARLEEILGSDQPSGVRT